MQAITDLYNVILLRQAEGSRDSYTVRLLEKGTNNIAKKVGEEAVEVVIEAVAKNNEKLLEETSDLLYHLVALWVSVGVTPDQVSAVLESRKR